MFDSRQFTPTEMSKRRLLRTVHMRGTDGHVRVCSRVHERRTQWFCAAEKSRFGNSILLAIQKINIPQLNNRNARIPSKKIEKNLSFLWISKPCELIRLCVTTMFFTWMTVLFLNKFRKLLMRHVAINRTRFRMERNIWEKGRNAQLMSAIYELLIKIETPLAPSVVDCGRRPPSPSVFSTTATARIEHTTNTIFGARTALTLQYHASHSRIVHASNAATHFCSFRLNIFVVHFDCFLLHPSWYFILPKVFTVDCIGKLLSINYSSSIIKR